MRIIFTIVAVVGAAHALSEGLQAQLLQNEFKRFKQQFDKSYSQEEGIARFKTFTQNLESIAEKNEILRGEVRLIINICDNDSSFIIISPIIQIGSR